MTQNYTEGYEYLSSQFPEVSGYDFYREMFPNNERSDERHMDYSHPNAIYLYREQTSDGFKRMRPKNHVLHDSGKMIIWNLSNKIR